MQTAFFMSGVCFLWGVLRDAALWRDRDLQFEPATLPGFAVAADPETGAALLVRRCDGLAQGALLRGVDAAKLQAMAGLEGEALTLTQVTVQLAQGAQVQALALLPQPALVDQGFAPWDFAQWQARYGADYALVTQEELAPGRLGPLLARAGARRRAAAQISPVTRRHRAGAQDIACQALRKPYAQFFAVEEVDLRFRRFDGSLSPQVSRAGFVSADAVAVLPYDPQRDRVLLVEQFRIGPFLRGDPQPWQLEAIAGRIDAGESPEAAARREAQEEAGLRVTDLRAVANYYPSPGAFTEYLYSFLALTALPDHAAGVFGLASEAEDIRGHLISFDQLMALAQSGEIGNGPLLLLAYWLAANRKQLRRSPAGNSFG